MTIYSGVDESSLPPMSSSKTISHAETVDEPSRQPPGCAESGAPRVYPQTAGTSSQQHDYCLKDRGRFTLEKRQEILEFCCNAPQHIVSKSLKDNTFLLALHLEVFPFQRTFYHLAKHHRSVAAGCCQLCTVRCPCEAGKAPALRPDRHTHAPNKARHSIDSHVQS